MPQSDLAICTNKFRSKTGLHTFMTERAVSASLFLDLILLLLDHNLLVLSSF